MTQPTCNRRDCLRTSLSTGLSLSLGVWPSAQASTATPLAEQPFWRLAREGGNIFLMRHAQTVSGIGDPPSFRLGDCSTQRNLSEAGIAESQQLGARFVQQQVPLHEVRSSAWCRCIDTARHAFDPHYPTHQVWAPLNSFFQGQGNAQQQTRQALARARQLPPSHNWMWVTHQVNISALTGRGTSMGEVLLCRSASSNNGQLAVLASLNI